VSFERVAAPEIVEGSREVRESPGESRGGATEADPDEAGRSGWRLWRESAAAESVITPSRGRLPKDLEQSRALFAWRLLAALRHLYGRISVVCQISVSGFCLFALRTFPSANSGIAPKAQAVAQFPALNSRAARLVSLLLIRVPQGFEAGTPFPKKANPS